VLLAAVLVAAFVASKSCASRETKVSQAEAVEIAKRQVDYTAARIITRFIPRGVKSRPTWAVSLERRDVSAGVAPTTIVVIDARDGHVIEIRG
jgi:predicted sulfurtransferase